MLARGWRIAAAAGALMIFAAVAALVVAGLTVPAKWTENQYAGGFIHGTHLIMQPPFPAFSRIDLFDINVNNQGTHFYLLGSDPGGRDLLAITARGTIPSLLLVGLVIAARVLVGILAGLAMGAGSGLIRALSRGMGRWVIGFPYLALAIIMIHAISPYGRIPAFVAGMAVVGWRDIAELVSERVEYVRNQPFALAATSLGTRGLTFFRLHVVPFLRPALAVELAFQASAVLVLLAELGYLQVYLGPVIAIEDVGRGGASIVSNVILTQPELGQLLADSRRYILFHQLEPVLVPALAIATLALAFELLGTALRGRIRLGRGR